jgi:uncharacterized protein
MSDKTLKIVIDTNLWVSMAMGSKVVSEQMMRIIGNSNFELFISSELLEELVETLKKPRLQKHLSLDRTKFLFDLIWMKTQLVNVSVDLKLCRDPKDDFIINLATEIEAQYIITGDFDLLVMNPIGSIEVLTISTFLEQI